MTARNGRSGAYEAPGKRIAAIDGLRAVAILSVLIYHAGFDLLPGGLAGVDVFFVISGFVVSRSILADSGDRTGTLLAKFYARRLRRIAPALVVMLTLATLAYCLFVPSAWLSDTVQRVDLFSFVGLSNVALSLNGDEYFSPIATLNPFTHTWSLGVEEQFYLVLPAILILSSATKRGRNMAVVSLAIVALAFLSLIACVILSQTHQRLTFYSIATRFWELGVGVLLCLTERGWKPAVSRTTASVANLVTIAGAAAILFALASPPGPRFPFPIALVCDFGTAVIIVIAVARPATATVRVFGASPISTIGRASYSIYLWHWPLIVLMRWTIGLEDASYRLIAGAGALALGFASYRFVELPSQRWSMFRTGSPRRQICLQLLFLAMGALISTGLLLGKDRISFSRTADTATWYTSRGDHHVGPPALHAVRPSRTKFEGGLVRIFSPDSPIPKNLFVIGDSHSLSYLPALRRLAEETGITARAYFAPNCSFLQLRAPMAGLKGCNLTFYRRALSDIAATGHRGDVLFLPNLRLSRYVDQWGPARRWPFNPTLRSRATSEAVSVLRPIAARGITILFESPTPVFRSVPFRCSDWFNRMNPICAAGFDVDRSEMDVLRAPPLAQMRAIGAQLPGVRIWNAFDLLCPSIRCSAFRGDRPLFLDGDHLSAYGIWVLYPSLKEAVVGTSADDAGRVLRH